MTAMLEKSSDSQLTHTSNEHSCALILENETHEEDFESGVDEEVELIYATPEQMGLSKVVLDMDKTLSTMLLCAIIALISIIFCFYHLVFEVDGLFRHQKIFLGIFFLVQSSVMANTFVVKQTLIKGNLTAGLQITTGLDVSAQERRGHLLFIRSLYSGSSRVTLFLSVMFLSCIIYIYNVTELPIDIVILVSSVFFIVPNVLSTILVYIKNKKVRSLLLSQP